MGYIEDHIKRWRPIFEREPWWEMHQALYEGPGHDWEGASAAMEQMVYAIAEARGLDTKQTCNGCNKLVDQVATLGSVDCDACEQQQAWEWQAWELELEEGRIIERLRRSKLTDAERQAEDEWAREQSTMYLRGLITRNVQ